MASSSVPTPTGRLRIERDVIPVHYESDLDRNWRFTDAAGHEHYCDYDGADHYPTLAYVAGPLIWCGRCHDEHEDYDVSRYECRLCGETIRPGTTGPGTKYLPGMTRYFLDDEPVSKERAEEVIAGMQAQRDAQAERTQRDGICDLFGIPQALRDQWDRLAR